MKQMLRLMCLTLATLMLMLPVAQAASTPTPPPVMIRQTPAEPPAVIQEMLDIAYTEWETLAGKTLPRCNKYTEWRGKGVSFGWCAGYITWCMLEAGVPQYEIEHFLDTSNDTAEGFYPVEGVMHVQEAGVGKLLRAYQRMNRTTMIPQPGYILVYGCSYNKTIHVGLVYEVIDLGGGRYRITTLEGNMANRVKMYIHDYDMNAVVKTNNRKSTNLSVVPESERTLPESTYVDYSIPMTKPSDSATSKYTYYVHCFLMPWVPGGAEPTATPVPTAEPTPAPTATPAPAATPTPMVTPEPAPEVTAAPEAAVTAAPAPEVTATPEPAPAEDIPAAPTYPCQGKGGECPYVTRSEDDPFCRACDRNDNGIEDALE
ncbi:MAG: CHAP domain-containing protein [Clostridia bacterium]|nr:CHAP domain-containing protein [Clostridia bacterium]